MDFKSFQTAIESMGFKITKFSNDSKFITVTHDLNNTSILVENKNLEEKFNLFADKLIEIGADRERERIEVIFENIKLGDIIK